MNRGGEDPEEEQRASTAFFIMPAEALMTLREELSPLASEMAVKAILFRYGYRSGEACVQSMGIDRMAQKEMPDVLLALWDEIGMGRLSVKTKKGGFALHLEESIEGIVVGDIGQTSCDFTRGYLAGMVSYLTGKSYYGKEEKCVSNGDDLCTFKLSKRAKRGEK